METSNTNFRNNSADYGGTINNQGEILIDSNLIANNYSDNSGAGIDNNGIAEIINTTISGNKTGTAYYDLGGGIYNEGNIDLSFVTIDNNFADDDGAGIFNSSGTINIKSSIISNNEDYSGANINCGGTISSYNYNIDKDGTCGLSGVNDQIIDPLLSFRGIVDNGGYCKTIAIAPFSPAKDIIPEAECTDISGNAVTMDQRGLGYNRPDPSGMNNVCDVGAYEIQ